MKCPKCGTTVKDDAKFCFACGAKLEQPKAVAEPEKIEVQHVKMKPEAPKAKKKGNNKKVGKIVVAVGVCAAVVVVGVNIVPRLTQTDNPCVYLSDSSYNLLTKMKKTVEWISRMVYQLPCLRTHHIRLKVGLSFHQVESICIFIIIMMVTVELYAESDG